MNAVRALVVTLIAIVATTVPAAAQRQTTESVAALERWVAAVNAHTPGKPDSSIEYATALRYSGRVDLHTAYLLFIRVLRAEAVVARTDMDANVIDQARKARENPGPSAFLKRAAVLHSDAVIFADRFPAAKDDAPAPLPRTIRETADGFASRVQRDAAPPLLLNEWVTLTRDGELIGSAKADWNIPFARALLDVLLRLPVEGSERPAVFAGEWYHAVAAFLFSRGNFADAGPHLEHGARVLPDNPQVLFDLGTSAETYGLPVYQVVLDDPVVRKPGVMTAGLPSENKANTDAERAYRRTIAVDPAHVEARVRLARLLERRGQIDQAATQIENALEAKPTGVPAFYASLVAGRIASTRGRFDEALLHYRNALALFAHAQSALLGASHAALMGADVPAALKPLAELTRDETPDSDPWLEYQLGAGRDSTALLEALWRRVAEKR